MKTQTKPKGKCGVASGANGIDRVIIRALYVIILALSEQDTPHERYSRVTKEGFKASLLELEKADDILLKEKE